MIKRTLSKHLVYLSTKFPIVTLTGPRQSGKTTLIKSIFSSKNYVSLEDPDVREFATIDPRGFLNHYKEGAVIDEIQHVPALFSYIQTRVDESKRMGEFVLSGSQNFLLLEKIAQSLAGRSAIAHLLPLSIHELLSANYTFENAFNLIQKGFYPRIYDKDIRLSDWSYSSI